MKNAAEVINFCSLFNSMCSLCPAKTRVYMKNCNLTVNNRENERASPTFRKIQFDLSPYLLASWSWKQWRE